MLLTFTSFFFEPKITKMFTFFHFFNIFLEKSEVFMNKCFKKKKVNVSSMQQTLYHVCFMFLTFTSFFLNQKLPKCSLFFHFFNIFSEKSEVFMSKIFKKKAGKCQKHATNLISCLFHASDIYLFFLNQKLPKCSHFFTFHFFNIFLDKAEVFMNK